MKNRNLPIYITIGIIILGLVIFMLSNYFGWFKTDVKPIEIKDDNLEIKENPLPGDLKEITELNAKCKTSFESWKKWVISDESYYNQIKSRAKQSNVSVAKRLEQEWIYNFNNGDYNCYQ